MSAGFRWPIAILVAGGAAAALPVRGADDLSANVAAAIEIQDPAAGVDPDFDRDILPFLKRSCLACHHANSEESDVILETPQAILEYDPDDPLVVARDVTVGRLFPVASRSEEPVMPPVDNDVGADPLTPVELGLLKRWIENGAKSGDAASKPPSIAWQPLPPGRRPILAAAITDHGGFSVSSRGNTLTIYDLIYGRPVAELVDPELAKIDARFEDAAHLDLIRSIATWDDGEWIASGGYRTVKLWQRVRAPSVRAALPLASATATAFDRDGEWMAVGDPQGRIAIVRLSPEHADDTPISWQAHDRPIIGLAATRSGSQLISVADDGLVRRWSTAGALQVAWKLSVPPLRMVLIADEVLVTSSDDRAPLLWNLEQPMPEPESAPESTDSADKDEDGSGPPSSDSVQQPPAPIELQPAKTFAGHTREVTSLASVPGDPPSFASGSIDGTVRVWDIEAASVSRQRVDGKTVLAIAVSPDGATIVTADEDGMARIWGDGTEKPLAAFRVDFRAGRELLRREHDREIATANVSVANQALESARKQLATDEEAHKQAEQALAEAVTSANTTEMAVSETKSRHQSASSAAARAAELLARVESSLAAVQADSGKSPAYISEAEGVLESARDAVAARPAAEATKANETSTDGPPTAKAADGDTSLQGAADALASSLEVLREHRRQLGGRLQAVRDAAKQESDEASAQAAALAKEVELAEKAAAAARTARDDAEIVVRRGLEGVAASQQVVARAEDKVAIARKVQARYSERIRAYRDTLETPPPIVAATFSKDGTQVLFGQASGQVTLFDVASGRPLDAWQTGSEAVLTTVDFLSDDQVMAVSGGDDPVLHAWSTRPTWRLARSIGDAQDPSSPLTDRVLALDFSPDGSWLAIGSGQASRTGQVVLWNRAEGRIEESIPQPHADAVLAIAFSRDGEYLASASADRMMRVFRVGDTTWSRDFEGHTHHVVDVAWRANGLQLATCSADKTIKIWDFESAEQLRTIRGAGKELTGLDYLGIGSELVSVSGDRTVRVHNADDGKQARSFTGASDYLYSCATTGSGDVVVTGGADRILRVFTASDGSERFAFAAGASESN